MSNRTHMFRPTITDMQDKYCGNCYDIYLIQSQYTKAAACGRHHKRVVAVTTILVLHVGVIGHHVPCHQGFMFPRRPVNARDYLFVPFPWTFIELNRQPHMYSNNRGSTTHLQELITGLAIPKVSTSRKICFRNVGQNQALTLFYQRVVNQWKS